MIPEGTVEPYELAGSVLRHHWNRDAEYEQVAVGRNRKTFLAGDAYLTACRSRDSPKAYREIRVRSMLGQHGFPFDVPRTIETVDSALTVEESGWIWWLTGAIAGRSPEASNPSDQEAAADALGRLHRSLPSALVGASLGLPHPSSAWQGLALSYLARSDCLVSAPDRPLIRQIAGFYEAWRSQRVAVGQPTHGDPSLPNMLIGEIGEVTAFLDWESVCVDDPIFDVAALALSITTWSGDEDMVGQLDRLISTYSAASEVQIAPFDLVHAMLGCTLEGVSVHGTRASEGEAGVDFLSETIAVATKLSRMI